LIVDVNVDVAIVLNALPSLQFSCFYPTTLTVNPDEERRTREYFDILNRNPQNQSEEMFQQEEFRQTVQLINQVDDRNMYVFKRNTFLNYRRFKTPPQFANQSHFVPQHGNMQVLTELGRFSRAVLEQTTSNFRCILLALRWLTA
jgi:hypothetical protein